MPLVVNKPRGKKAEAAENRNAREIGEVLGGAPAHFARVEKNLGSYFKLVYHDGETVQDLTGEPIGLFRRVGKMSNCSYKITCGDIVLLEGVQKKTYGRPLVVEIKAVLDKKVAQKLYRAQRIHESVYRGTEQKEGDDLFDYGEAEEEGVEDEDDDAPRVEKKRGQTVVKANKRGAAGRGTQDAPKKVVDVKEHMEAAKYVEHAAVDLDEMADGLGLEKAPKVPKAPSAPSAPSVSVEKKEAEAAPLTDAWDDVDVKLKSYDNCENADEEDLDIDAI
jgi:hypothetical protein